MEARPECLFAYFAFSVCWNVGVFFAHGLRIGGSCFRGQGVGTRDGIRHESENAIANDAMPYFMLYHALSAFGSICALCSAQNVRRQTSVCALLLYCAAVTSGMIVYGNFGGNRYCGCSPKLQGLDAIWCSFTALLMCCNLSGWRQSRAATGDRRDDSGERDYALA
jgi:hypothetical protein